MKKALKFLNINVFLKLTKLFFLFSLNLNINFLNNLNLYIKIVLNIFSKYFFI